MRITDFQNFDQGFIEKAAMIASRTHFYRDVPRLGNVAVTRHAQARMIDNGITQQQFDKALFEPQGPDRMEGYGVLWRERDGVRIVILTNPIPNAGARLVKTVFRVQAQARER
jgi:hypothetical protein